MGNTKTTIYLPDELREKLFIERARTNKPIREIVIEALKKYFEEKEESVTLENVVFQKLFPKFSRHTGY